MDDRAMFRNVHFYNAASPNTILGGLIQNSSVTRKSALYMLDIILVRDGPIQDGYKIVVFDLDLDGLDGRVLDAACRRPDDPHRVSDDVLRWHFRQSVLANVRGVGEPAFEDDFPPGQTS
ncbi:uncharacterized protein DNG_04959 [Cephalotrichum gorgonifer]|uniref:DUF7881 domain-containing protein n=1 Tax=Cephalotrichum gorgonifer TaxID=2041049 RepID=A0AAE8MX07_9PEZI|nr:uncharacterized protein DNG_04959 [Cephalotrichum gorgonifer]